MKSTLLSRKGTGDPDFEREMLLAGGLLDEPWYREQTGARGYDDPAGHYVNAGWRAGLEPNPAFPGSFFLPYFAEAGLHGPPAVTWITLKSAGWAVYDSREQVEAVAAAVRESGLFDESSYVARANLAGKDLDPATHYVLAGERLGIAPSPLFDPSYYAARNTDVGAVNLLLHYVRHGLAEARRALPMPPPPKTENPQRFDPLKENILFVVNNASRTGAPILGWNIGTRLARKYNVFTVLIGDGELKGDFAETSVELYGPCVDAGGWSSVTPIDFEYSLGQMLESRKFRYAIVNSSESCTLVAACLRRFIPTLLLVHEFAVYAGHFALSEFLRDALEVSSEVIFPASIVAKNAEEYFPNLAHRRLQIRPQGLSALPAPRGPRNQGGAEEFKKLRRQCEQDGAFVVVGAGAIHFMKGVDLFLAIAAAVKRGSEGRPIHFVWVGQGFALQGQTQYPDFLREQVKRSGLIGTVTFLDEVSDLEPLYELADVFLLASRLDPLPNVSIDAAARGIPVVCFKGASGMAELLQGNAQTAPCAVEHLDTQAAADFILELASDEARLAHLSDETRRFAKNTFDMDAYVESLDRLGSAAAIRMAQQRKDARLLLADGTFDQNTFLGPSPIVESRRETISRYLAVASVRTDRPELQDWEIRRPSPGFNPHVYTAAHAGRLDRGANPFADFVRRGKPRGPWQAAVLRPDDPATEDRSPSHELRVAIQAHFFYPELAADLLARIQLNRTRCDLLISTDDAEKAQTVRRLLSDHTGGNVEVRVVPNRGRDIAPLLTGFADVMHEYDVVGHVHAKRSSWHENKDVGEVWRGFLWENLIGGLHPMMDRILRQFELEPQLGLVFPADPHIIGWTKNRALAISLAHRMGQETPLPDAFDFPVGTMFWIRAGALRPLIDLKLSWEDYPPEPLPIDGTILHALERLLPFSARLAGFTYAETHVPGVMR